MSAVLKARKATTPWLVCPKPNPHARLRLFCFPYAGGGTYIYRAWQSALPSAVEVWAVQPPGRGNRLREPSFGHLSPLVRAAAPALAPYLDVPFAFFGHSMGAVISFELCRLLRREYGLSPRHLFVSGRRAPQVNEPKPPTYNLPEPEFLKELRELNGTPREVLEQPELLQIIIPILRADFAVCQTYDYAHEAAFDFPITAYGGTEDGEVKYEHLGAWREQTTKAFCVRLLPGDHFFLNTHQQLLLQSLARELEQVAAKL